MINEEMNSELIAGLTALEKAIEDVEETVLAKGKITTKLIDETLQKMGATVWNNLTTGKMVIEGMPAGYSKAEALNTLPVLIRDYLAEKGIKASCTRIVECLHVIADLNRMNPVIKMMTDTAYDGEDRITVLHEILGLTDMISDSEEVTERKARYRLYVAKWLHQCAAMALNDEDDPYGADGALVLQGEQGIGKTLFFRTIAVESQWFGEGISMDMSQKDAKIQATGKWIAELGELDSTLSRKQTSFKAFLTSQRDEIRSPYARAAVNKPRRTSFCGTVNPDRFLTDETGSRRFWVVKVKHIDLDALRGMSKEWLYQLWAQVYQTLYLPDPQGFRLTDAEQAQLQMDNMEFLVPIPGEAEILEKLCWGVPVEEWRYTTMTELVKAIGGVNAGQAGKAIRRLQKRDTRIRSKTVHNNIRKYLLPPVYSEEQALGVIKPLVS